MAEMKYYVTYGIWSQELMGKGMDAFNKAMEEWTKTIEEAGLKMVFWGVSAEWCGARGMERAALGAAALYVADAAGGVVAHA